MAMLLEMRNISKSFPGVKALNGFSIDLKAGEVHALVGENGAGKSTLIKTLYGIHQPDGGQWVYRGALKLLNNGATITLRGTISDEALATLTYIGNGKFLGIPVPVYLVLVMAIALNFVLRHTVFGRSVYAVGSNAETAKMSGINVQKVKLLAQSITGLMAGMAGIVMLCRMVSIQANTGEGYEFEGIFASVVGGVSMAGGEGTIFGAVIGALVVAVLRNGLNLNGINSFWQQVILGVLVLVVVYVDTRKTKKKRSV